MRQKYNKKSGIIKILLNILLFYHKIGELINLYLKYVSFQR